MNLFIGILTGVFITFVLTYTLIDGFRKEVHSWFSDPEEKGPETDHAFSSDDVQNIPEEDQDYLSPIMVAAIKEYIPIKRHHAQTNAQLINHLAIALKDAAGSHYRRKNNSDKIETGNRDWVKVAVWALRIYHEGTPHNCVATLDHFTTVGTLAEREIKNYARKMMQEINDRTKELNKEQGLEHEDEKDNEIPGRALGLNNPYTNDEIEDMKRAADRRNKGLE